MIPYLRGSVDLGNRFLNWLVADSSSAEMETVDVSEGCSWHQLCFPKRHANNYYGSGKLDGRIVTGAFRSGTGEPMLGSITPASRHDLYHRLQVNVIEIQPPRDRA